MAKMTLLLSLMSAACLGAHAVPTSANGQQALSHLVAATEPVVRPASTMSLFFDAKDLLAWRCTAASSRLLDGNLSLDLHPSPTSVSGISLSFESPQVDDLIGCVVIDGIGVSSCTITCLSEKDFDESKSVLSNREHLFDQDARPEGLSAAAFRVSRGTQRVLVFLGETAHDDRIRDRNATIKSVRVIWSGESSTTDVHAETIKGSNQRGQ
jgi:hypothetical protein